VPVAPFCRYGRALFHCRRDRMLGRERLALITAGSPTTYFGVLAVTSTSRSIPGQTRALTTTTVPAGWITPANASVWHLPASKKSRTSVNWPALGASPAGLDIAATCRVAELYRFAGADEWCAIWLLRECCNARTSSAQPDVTALLCQARFCLACQPGGTSMATAG
jgi:hypothetical protein